MAKVCGNCGHPNREEAGCCEECGWKLPSLDPATKIGRRLRRLAIGILLLSFLPCLTAPDDGTAAGQHRSAVSLLCLLAGAAIAATLYWIGAFLSRRPK